MQLCQCGAQAGYAHRVHCPAPLYGDDPEMVAKWNDARKELIAGMIKNGEWVRRWTCAPESYDSWGTFTLTYKPVLAFGRKCTLREAYVHCEQLGWHESRWSSGLHAYWSDEQFEVAKKYDNVVEVVA